MNIYAPACEADGCRTRPHYGVEGERARFCSTHKVTDCCLCPAAVRLIDTPLDAPRSVCSRACLPAITSRRCVLSRPVSESSPNASRLNTSSLRLTRSSGIVQDTLTLPHRPVPLAESSRKISESQFAVTLLLKRLSINDSVLTTGTLLTPPPTPLIFFRPVVFAQLRGMVDVLNRRCSAKGCRRQPSWARKKGDRALFCKVCRALRVP